MAAFSFDGSGSGEHDTSGAGDNSGTGDAFGAVSLGSVGDGSGNGSGDVDAAGTTFDPSIHSGRDKLNADGSYRKKRGRKSGGAGPTASANRPKTRADYSASVDALSSTLMVVHAGLASLTKVEELALDKEDGDNLAKAVANVLVEFDVTPDPKIQAIVGLVMTAGMIYGPKMVLYKSRTKPKKKATLTVITPGGASSDYIPGNDTA